MNEKSANLRLADIIEAVERIRSEVGDLSFDAFEANWQKRWLVERGVEIISEASRRLPDEVKTRHPEIPWKKVAGIGNVLRHEYERISAPVLWSAVHDDFPQIEKVCRTELSHKNNRTGKTGN